MSTTSIQNTAKKGIIGVNKCVDLTYNDPYACTFAWGMGVICTMLIALNIKTLYCLTLTPVV